MSLRFARPEWGVLTTTVGSITYTARYYPTANGVRGYWTIRTSDREALEPGYDNDWYEPSEARVRASIAAMAAKLKETA